MLVSEHTPGGAYGIERVCLASRATFALDTANLENSLAVIGYEAGESRPVRSGALDREDTTAGRVTIREQQRRLVAGAVSLNARLEQHPAAAHLDDRERMPVAVRVGQASDQASERAPGRTGLLTPTYLAKDIRNSEITFAISHKQRTPAPPSRQPQRDRPHTHSVHE